MNNHWDDSNNSLDNLSSQLDDFMHSLGIDTQPQNIDQNHLHDNNLHNNNLQDSYNPYNLTDHSHDMNIQNQWHDQHQSHGQLQDDTHHNQWHDSSHLNTHSSVDHTHHQTDINHSQWHQLDHNHAHQSINHHQDIQRLNCSYSSTSSGYSGPHIEIKNSHVYRHNLNGSTTDVGYIRNDSMYNSSDRKVGYMTNSGKVYKYNYDGYPDTYIGYVKGTNIYNASDKLVGKADTSMEGAAHLLFFVYGGART